MSEYAPRRRFDGTLVAVPFGAANVERAVRDEYRGLLNRHDPEDVLVLTGAPTSPETVRAMLGEELPGAATPFVTSLVVHATDVLDRTDDRVVLSDALRRELLHRFLAGYEWDTEYLRRASEQLSFVEDVDRVTETLSWQAISPDETPELRDVAAALGALHVWLVEQAATQNTRRREDWIEICERLASRRRAAAALPAAKQCIDRYFELELSGYEIVDAEREFELDIDDHELVGFIDAVYRTPDGELLVIDYKATERHRDLRGDKQLPIYLLACRDLYDEPVVRAGYAYVGDIGPTVESRTFGDDELDAVGDDVTAAMNRIAELAFTDYVAGDHCRWCRHNQLPCAADSLDEREEDSTSSSRTH